MYHDPARITARIVMAVYLHLPLLLGGIRRGYPWNYICNLKSTIPNNVHMVPTGLRCLYWNNTLKLPLTSSQSIWFQTLCTNINKYIYISYIKNKIYIQTSLGFRLNVVSLSLSELQASIFICFENVFALNVIELDLSAHLGLDFRQ